jgi:hypothetical protein
MKNQAEIFQALLDGKKIHHHTWVESGGYVHMVDGDVYTAVGNPYIGGFAIVKNWSVYDEKSS